MIQLRASNRRQASTNGEAHLRSARDASRNGRRTPTLTPVGAIVRGAVAGVAGTAAMDALLFARYRRNGGTSTA
jgi:hypothetical protein